MRPIGNAETMARRDAEEDWVADDEYFDRREMEMVHVMLRRELGLLPKLIQETTDAERAAHIADHFSFVADTLHHHHCSEDDYVWPLLAERTPESADELLAVMNSQHSELATQLEKVRAAMLTWSAACTADQGTLLVNAFIRFNDMLDQHLSAEEELVVPLMEQLITASEWDWMVQKGAAAADPATLPLGFGMLMYEGDPEIVGRALSVMPAESRPVIRKLAADAYAEHAQRIHGTQTPLHSTDV